MKFKLITIFFFFSIICYAQQDNLIPMESAYKRVYNITKISGEKPSIDGRLDEMLWTNEGQWSEDFVQSIPVELKKSPSFTRMKLFYDDKNIYIGVYCKDVEPDKMNAFLSDRDNNTMGDLVSVSFDTYHDFRAALQFDINLGGNKTDQIMTDKQMPTLSWNAVWEARTHINSSDSSWTAEFRIPFSQLRYNQTSNEGIWGLNVARTIRSNNEIQQWSIIPLRNNGYVFSFGELHGMKNLPKSHGVEFLPYTMGKFMQYPEIPGSPYQTGEDWSGNVGLDAKVSVSDFTLDMTINPDYGQVELDPSVMNLTTYETFYDEKRPFFLEGKYIFDFGNGTDNMFYTRRIGSSPSLRPMMRAQDSIFYTETPGNVPILGAVKLTGTTSNGLSVGLVESVTGRTTSRVTRNQSESEEVVEPLTNYTVARVQKNWQGNTLLGGMLTSMNRDLSGSMKDVLLKDAFAGGIDFTQYFKNRLYFVDVKAMYSAVYGSNEAITALQTSPTHYYQRKSADHYLKVDSTKTSMTGTAGSVQVGRSGNSRWTIAETFSWYTPGFDINGVGFMREADAISNTTTISYRKPEAWGIFRSNTLSLMQFNTWNFGKICAYNSASLMWMAMLKNRFEISLMEGYDWNRLDTRLLRSGPDLRYDPTLSTTLTVNSDRAMPLVLTLMYMNGYNTYSNSNTFMPSLTYRAGSRVYLSAQLNIAANNDDAQYVGELQENPFDMSSSQLYVLGRIEQRTYGLTLRAQVNITPDISLQLYGAPFTSTAKYSQFKLATDPTSHNRDERFEALTHNLDAMGFGYETNYNSKNYYFNKPDFSFNEFRSNLVIRWEYRPGSNIYLVWANSSSVFGGDYEKNWFKNLDKMFGSQTATNVFMLKMNYWFAL